MREGPIALDLSKLAPASSRIAARLFNAIPDAQAYSRMEGSAYADLLVEIPSPTGDPDRQLVIWMEGGDEPSLAFGEWHTHVSPSEDGKLFDLAKAILADQLVLAYHMSEEQSGYCDLIDLRDPDALLEELTSEHSSGHVRTRTWSGRGDREFSSEDRC